MILFKKLLIKIQLNPQTGNRRSSRANNCEKGSQTNRVSKKGGGARIMDNEKLRFEK